MQHHQEEIQEHLQAHNLPATLLAHSQPWPERPRAQDTLAQDSVASDRALPHVLAPLMDLDLSSQVCLHELCVCACEASAYACAV